MIELMKHQKDGVDFILKNGGIGALFWEIGCGKTIGALNIYKNLREKNPGLKMFVICPLSLIESAWGEDINKFTDYVYCNLYKYPVDIPAEIYIANFEYIISKKNQDILNLFLSKHQWLCVIDESSRLKNNTAKTTKTILKIKDKFKYRVVMSGTPAPNSELEYWGQISFLQDRIFHPSFYAFRNTYFHLARGNQVIPGQTYSKMGMADLFKKGWKYSISKQNRERMFARMAPLCNFVKKIDCVDLPEQIDQVRTFEIDGEQLNAYKSMKNHSIAEIMQESKDPSFVVAKIALTKLMKLRQITSGFAIDDQSQIKKFGINPRIKELKNTLEEIGDKQVIIWCNFHQEFRDVSEIIDSDKYCMIYGEIPIQQREQAIIDFKDGKKQYLIANPASAGHGLTFVNCSIQIFYSIDFSFEKYEQARGRIHRVGQKNQCLYIHLLCEDSIDKYVFDVVNKKKDMHETIVNFIKNERD